MLHHFCFVLFLFNLKFIFLLLIPQIPPAIIEIRKNYKAQILSVPVCFPLPPEIDQMLDAAKWKYQSGGELTTRNPPLCTGRSPTSGTCTDLWPWRSEHLLSVSGSSSSFPWCTLPPAVNHQAVTLLLSYFTCFAPVVRLADGSEPLAVVYLLI